MLSKTRPIQGAHHPKDSSVRHGDSFVHNDPSLQVKGKNARLRREELRQLVRHSGIHLRRIAVIEILRTADCLSLRQHLLDERRELDCANGIVVEYLAEFKCEPLLNNDADRYPCGSIELTSLWRSYSGVWSTFLYNSSNGLSQNKLRPL